MHPNLRSMTVVLGLVALGGGAFYLSTPQPATRSMTELRDAGVGDGQKLVIICPERLTDVARRRITRTQPGALRANQRYAMVARVGVCFRGDGALTNCFDANGDIRPGADGGTIIVPSLRQDADGGLSEDAGETDGESDEADDSYLYRQDECHAVRCADFDAGSPAPFATAFCSRLNRMMAVTPPCVVPNCWTLPDGGWDDNAAVDCRTTASSPWGDSYRGCNVLPGQFAIGAACVPSACSVVAGDNPPDWL